MSRIRLMRRILAKGRNPPPDPVAACARAGKAISLVKSNSASWMNEHGLEFNWQQVYRATCVQFETVQSPGIAYVFLNGPRWLKDVKLTRQCGSIRTPI